MVDLEGTLRSSHGAGKFLREIALPTRSKPPLIQLLCRKSSPDHHLRWALSVPSLQRGPAAFPRKKLTDS